MTIIQLEQPSLGETSVCDSCHSIKWLRHGFARNGIPRWRCGTCNKTSTHITVDKFRAAGMRVDTSRIINFLVAIGKGFTLRTASALADIKADTGTKILEVSGVIRLCRKCRKPLSGNRFLYCSDSCQSWRTADYRTVRQKRLASTGSKQLYDGSANVLRYIEDSGCSPHVRLAIEIASEISERNMDLYLGPVYEGIETGHAAGIRDPRVLRRFGRDAVSKHWKEIQTYGARSLDAMKEAHGFEYADPESPNE